MKLVDIKGGIVLDDVFLVMKHVKFRLNRLHMDFVINGSWCSLVTENGPFIDNPLPIWSGQDQSLSHPFTTIHVMKIITVHVTYSLVQVPTRL
jgi:hypothetical protein